MMRDKARILFVYSIKSDLQGAPADTQSRQYLLIRCEVYMISNAL